MSKKIPLYIEIDEDDGLLCGQWCPFLKYHVCNLFDESLVQPAFAINGGEIFERCSQCFEVDG